MKRTEWTPESDFMLIKWTAERVPVREISEKLGIPMSTIAGRKLELGISKLRNTNEAYRRARELVLRRPPRFGDATVSLRRVGA